MNEFTGEHKKALAIASLLTAVCVAGAALYAVKSGLFVRVLPPGTVQPPENGEAQKTMEEAVRSYIRTLPSYDAQAQPPLTFAGIQFLDDNVRQVRMTSERTLLGTNVQQQFRVFYQDGRVISHEVWHSVGKLQVQAPEPEQIVPAKEFVVRGNAGALAPVTITLAAAEAPETVLAETMVTSEQDGSYAVTFRSVTAPSSALVITASSGDSILRIPVVLDTYAQSN